MKLSNTIHLCSNGLPQNLPLRILRVPGISFESIPPCGSSR